VLVATNVVVAVMLLAAGSVYGYVQWRFGQINRVTIPSLFQGGHGSSGQPMTILIVGSDSRAGITGNDAQAFGNAAQVAGQRSDTIMLLHIDPRSTRATLMSIPRDLWVHIPGKNFEQRVNTTFDTGPDLLVQAIKQDLGIEVNHYVEVNFDSFRQVVDAVAGVKQYFPTPARDAFSDLNIPNAGCYTLNGQMALQFVRARHYEYFENGRWQVEGESDLARIKRQQQFVKKMIAKAQSSGFTNPLELNRIIGGVTNNLTVDTGFSQNLMLSLAKRFRSLSPDSLPTTTPPTTPTVIQGNDVLLLKQPDATTTIANFLGTPQSSSTATTRPAAPPNVHPGEVRVAVLNGSGRTGEAGRTELDLQRQGFVVTRIGSADNFGHTQSVIRYAPGAEARAQLLASVVQGSTISAQPDSSIIGADVVLITGQSYTGISAVPSPGKTARPASGRPTTTVPAPTPPTTAYALPGAPPGFTPPPGC
jgi:LCP family protein required for cell wall assembly